MEVIKGKGGAQQSSREVTRLPPQREEKTLAPDFLLSSSFCFLPLDSQVLCSCIVKVSPFLEPDQVDGCSPPQCVQQRDPSAGSWARSSCLSSQLPRFCWAGPLLLGTAYSSRYPDTWWARPHIPTECLQGLSGKRANEQGNVWGLSEARPSLLSAGVAPAWRNEAGRSHRN